MAPVPRRVVLTGAESTGKTTLARTLAAHYRTSWVPEFAREYAESRPDGLSAADVEPIARGQSALERAASTDRDLVILDTDLVSTAIYARHYYGSVPDWVEVEIAAYPPSLYLLCETDVPWTADAARDPVADRELIQRLFRESLRQRGVAVVSLTGSLDDRLAGAIKAIG